MASADDFTRLIDAVGPEGTNGEPPDGTLPMLRVVVPKFGVKQSYVVESPGDVHASTHHALEPWLKTMDRADHGTSGRTSIRLRLLQDSEQDAEAVWVMDEGIRILFADGSWFNLADPKDRWGVRPINDEPAALDAGAYLLEPITDEEYSSVERLLQLLWDGASGGTLTDAQERQVLAIARLIADQHRETEPGRTERWKLIGPIRSGLRYLMKELPKDTLAWWKLAELLSEIGWPNTLPPAP